MFDGYKDSPCLSDGPRAVEGGCRSAPSRPLVGGGVGTLSVLVFADGGGEGHPVIV